MRPKKMIQCLNVVSMLTFLFSLSILGGTAATAADKPSIEIYTTSARTDTYALCSGLEDMMRKSGSWGRASVMETLGSIDMIKTTYKLPTDRRKNVMMTNTMPSTAEALAGVKPYDRKYVELRLLAVFQYKTFGFIGYNDEIKEMKDLVGKRVGLWQKGSGTIPIAMFLLNDVAGIQDKVKIVHIAPPGMKDALMGGMADVVFAGGSQFSKTKFALSSYVENIRTAKPTYWVDVDQGAMEAAMKKDPLPDGYGWVLIPAGAFGMGDPKRDVGRLSWDTVLYVWNVMEDSTAYKLAKFIDEMGLAGEFGKYLPQYKEGIGGQAMVGLPGLTADRVHPGALKYYEEKGYKLGGAPFER